MIRRGSGDGMHERGDLVQHGKPPSVNENFNREPARDRLGPIGVTDRLVVPRKPGNAGGGKEPEFKVKV
jgi:hypothetical protein